MTYDPNSLLKIPKDVAAPLLSEAYANAKDEQAEWARYGRNVHQILQSERFDKAVCTALLIDSYPPNLAERLRAFFSTITQEAKS